jgi:hypothetical protein
MKIRMTLLMFLAAKDEEKSFLYPNFIPHAGDEFS